MKQAGTVIAIIGLIGVIYFTYQYMQDTETFSVLGVDVAATTGEVVPIILSALVMVGGILLGKKK
ncbi:MAG TPA: hypothetical protein DCE78_10575 [Bacteroidetes bacterium]|nr:hypothetical protein [Bacteroidota bacterium]